ncbi:MAG TPA: endonuclease/exonuclease/phosphatase family protein, partial [Verrucomicrobiae bacterium]|nr:endonuclease/exonuclease/phosphatase family protein [Verrucomicrobiae bacterium]
EGRTLIRAGIKRLRPDLLALQEVGSMNAFQELQASLKKDGLDFPFSEYVHSWDTNLHLAFLSKYPITERRPHTNESFLFQGRRLHVARGFGQIEIQVGRQAKVTVLSAHLKSKRQAGEFDQQGWREEEAVLFRAWIDAFLQRDPGGNLIVLGDLNDHISSRTLRTIIGRGRSKLFDPEPAERNGDSLGNPNPKYEPRRILWTHYFAKEETYSRLDYILLSRSLQPLVNELETYVLAMPDWGAASDHRPVCLRLELKDQREMRN